MPKLRPSLSYLASTLIALGTLTFVNKMPIADGQVSLALLLAAVVVSAWTCGWRAGVVSTAVLAVGNVMLHLAGDYSPMMESIRLTAFLSLSLLFLTLSVLRQDAEALLSESEMRLRAILDHSRDPIAVTRDGLHQFVNRAYVNMFGYQSQEELLGRSVMDVIAPEDHGAILRRLENRASGRENPDQYEAVGVRRNGSQLDLEIHVSSYQENGSELVLVILRDISERKRAFREKEALISELRDALSKVKTLHGLLPTCASCRKIRDENGLWHDMENYICEHSDADFSHGLCPTCAEELYPEVFGGKSSRPITRVH